MRRILILGSSGSGKSTFANVLGDKLGMDVIHLDSYFWKPNWTEAPESEWNQTLIHLLRKESWIMDGNYSNSLKLRLEYADTVIFLDYNRLTCLYRCIKRYLKFRGTNRPELALGCNEKIDWDFFLWIWKYPNAVKPKILSGVQEHPSVNMIILRGRRNATKFLNRVE